MSQYFVFSPEKAIPFGQVRTLVENGVIWFCATDVARCLGYQNPHDVIAKHCKSTGVAIREVIDSMKRSQRVKFINEGNVYRLIVRSQLPSAERFEAWLFDEVVPSIRKNGFYGKGTDGLPDFVRRYKANMQRIPSGYFPVLTELYIRLHSEFEKAGYIIPDKGAKGKVMTPDISVGKCFARFLRENDSEWWDKHKTYRHHYPDGRVVDAYMYPVEVLPMFIHYINERWLHEHAETYFRERDPKALEYLPKLLA